MAKRTASKRVISGSERAPVRGARRVGKVPADERIEVTVRLRRSHRFDVAKALRRSASRRMTREELATRFGASAKDAAVVEEFAREHGLSVGRIDLGRRSITLRGTAQAMQDAFRVKLAAYRTPDRVRYRQRQGGISVPPAVHRVVEGVFGLDDRPQARPHFRLLRRRLGGRRTPHAAGTSFTPTELAKLYEFPSGSGAGERIALIELGGGYDPGEMTRYFKGLGLATPPILDAISVDGAHNAPDGSPDSDDGEVVLDIEVAGAVAPRASIAVYFAPNTDRGFLDAVTTAVYDPKTTVVSISWGGPEESWTGQMRSAFEDAFQEAAALGIPVFIAAGDDGSSDGVGDGRNHADFPASAPHAIACGGTRLATTGSSISNEIVWGPPSRNGATGGGFSRYFSRPKWQKGVVSGGGTKRGLPDVCADADPETGYEVLVDGQRFVIGGTSAVAPLWAGLAAVCNAKAKKKPGFLAPSLYRTPASFRDITKGSNGSYQAKAGWDPCTGLGSPIGTKLFASAW
jgi:kumamolisin